MIFTTLSNLNRWGTSHLCRGGLGKRWTGQTSKSQSQIL